jgi:hypothetical protein
MVEVGNSEIEGTEEGIRKAKVPPVQTGREEYSHTLEMQENANMYCKTF